MPDVELIATRIGRMTLICADFPLVELTIRLKQILCVIFFVI